ncbi:hypothetical protein DPEC_G00126340 [Dallia pectoralis]|uniref:Uncharacterized protein n=1 Tax=Dallia pectoralis TaxID=75939 RepID=A0ACC2GRI5_DALPE|nr:hypothetical protein DPEC_G00126340 [Dallia pectoralis]
MTRVTQRQETVASWTLAQKQRAGEHWISSRWNAIDPVALNERWLRDCPGGILDSATAPPLSSRGSVKLGCEVLHLLTRCCHPSGVEQEATVFSVCVFFQPSPSYKN